MNENIKCPRCGNSEYLLTDTNKKVCSACTHLMPEPNPLFHDTSKQRVLAEGILAREGKRYTFYGVDVPRGFLPLNAFCNEKVGGSEGTRRLREMRDDGINWTTPKVMSVEVSEDGKTRKKTTYLYALLNDRHELDLEKCSRIVKKMQPIVEGSGQLALL